jgi:thiamine biosynthesis lipoprotein
MKCLLIIATVNFLLSFAQADSVNLPSPFVLEKTYFSMGSNILVKIEGASTDQKEIEAQLFRAINFLQDYENKISTWSKSSQLSAFNKPATNWFKFNPRVYNSLKEALTCATLSNEYFHPGLGNAIELWGLRNKLKIPTDRQIKNLKSSMNLAELIFEDKSYKIKKLNKNFKFEEGGFAKGEGLDLLLDQLKHKSISHIELNFAGQIYVKKPTVVSIAHPEFRDQPLLTIELIQNSISTSSISENKFQIDGKIYGHILNPKTLYPINFSKKSISVIHHKNILADCLSTGLLVMSENKQELLKWMKQHPEYQVILTEIKDNVAWITHSCNLKNKIWASKTNQLKIQFESNC